MATATGATYAEVLAAYNDTAEGGTVEIPAGEETWTSTLAATKGVWFKGVGYGSTIIHHASATIITYEPSAPENNTLFQISGIGFDGNDNTVHVAAGLIRITNHSTTHAITKVRIFDNRFKRAKDGIYVTGAVYGVAHGNDFDSVKIICRGLGDDRDSWDNWPFSFGSGNNFYYEDNTIHFTSQATSGYTGWVEGGQGGRFCLRYNIWDMSNTTGFLDLLDIHGNQSETGEQYSTMGAEIYENEWTNSRSGRWMYQRGGKLLMYENTYESSDSAPYIALTEEYDDALSPTDGDQIQHVNESYFWDNNRNSANVEPYVAGTSLPGVLTENSEFWIEDGSFDGSVGIGVGLRSARPESGLTTGVGYWATDESILYRATGATTWEEFYTPHTYPHPLRGVSFHRNRMRIF